MQVVEATRETRVSDVNGRPAYMLHAGRRYVLYDHEAAMGLRAGIIERRHTLDRALPPYAGEPLQHQRLLLPFIGRRGDALVTGKLLQHFIRCHPNVTVDIACRETAREIFELFPPVGEILEYPVSGHRLDVYDFHLSFEDIENIQGAANMPLSQVFSRCLRIDPPASDVHIELAHDHDRQLTIPDVQQPLAALHAGLPGDVRTYPWELLKSVAEKLLARDFAVVYFGHHDWDWQDDVTTSSRLYDFRGCTATPKELASLLMQADVVLTNDSFPMHLAGSLGRPTVTVFTASTPIAAQDYDVVHPAVSGFECAPCYQTTGACPMGHPSCLAHHAEPLQPSALAELIAARWESASRPSPVRSARR